MLKNKIKAVGKMSKVFATLRQESENIKELKDALGVSKLPVGLLQSGAEGIKQAIQSFEDAKLADLDNERLPPVAGSVNSGEAPVLPSGFVRGPTLRTNISDEKLKRGSSTQRGKLLQ
jgi:serine/threonine-protein phosphatase 2B catalytic subunit